jgi:hypothetical protein
MLLFNKTSLELSKKIPLWLKIIYTLFLCVLVPFYWYEYGITNFLWFSDVALLGTGLLLWCYNRLISNVLMLWFFPLALAWNIDFFGRIFSGYNFLGITNYMFKAEIPLFVRGLSLFHLWLPIVLIWLLVKFGYARRTWLVQIIPLWVLLLVTYLVTDPAKNINWTYGPTANPQHWLNPLFYLGILMLFLPLCVFLPLHYLLRRLFK